MLFISPTQATYCQKVIELKDCLCTFSTGIFLPFCTAIVILFVFPICDLLPTYIFCRPSGKILINIVPISRSRTQTLIGLRRSILEACSFCKMMHRSLEILMDPRPYKNRLHHLQFLHKFIKGCWRRSLVFSSKKLWCLYHQLFPAGTLADDDKLILWSGKGKEKKILGYLNKKEHTA